MATPMIQVDTSDTNSSVTSSTLPPKDKTSQAKVKLHEFEQKVKLARKALKHVDAAQRSRPKVEDKEEKQENNTNVLNKNVSYNNNDLHDDNSVEEIECSQRVSQLYNISANDSLNETIPLEGNLNANSDLDGANDYDELFSLVISLENHCIICNVDMSDLNITQHESHVNKCLDTQEKSESPKEKFLCFICSRDLTKYTEARRQQHVNRCVDDSESQTRNESQGSASGVEEPQATYGSIVDEQWYCLMCSKDFSALKIKGRMVHLKSCAKKNNVTPAQLKTLQEQLRGKLVVRPMQSTPAKPASKNSNSGAKKKKNVVLDITQLNIQKKSPEIKEKKPRKKKVVTSSYFDKSSEPSSDDDFKTPVKPPKKTTELRLSGEIVPKDEAEEKLMLAMALSESEKGFLTPPSSNGSTPRDLAGFSVKNTPEKSLDLEDELLADIPSTPQIKQSSLMDKYKKSAETSPSIWALQASDVDVEMNDSVYHTDVIPSSQKVTRPPLKLTERLLAVESIKQKTIVVADEETQSSQLLFMADVLHQDQVVEDDDNDETECNNNDLPVFAKPRPKLRPDDKSSDTTVTKISPPARPKPIEINVATPPHITTTQKVRVVKEQEEELNSMLDEWESENQFVSYEVLPDDVVSPFAVAKPELKERVSNTNKFDHKITEKGTIDLTGHDKSELRGVDDSQTIVSLSQFMERPAKIESPVATKSSIITTAPKATGAKIDQSSPSEEDRLVADKVTEIVLQYQRMIQSKKRELAMKMKLLKDEYYKEIGRLTVEKDKKIDSVRKQYRVNTSIDSEDDFDSALSSSFPTPVSSDQGGFMPIAVDHDEEDKPFFSRKKSSLSSSTGSDTAEKTLKQSNANIDATMPNYDNMSVEELKIEVAKVGVKPGTKTFMVGQLQQLWKLQSNTKKRKRDDEPDSPPAKKSKNDSTENSMSEDDQKKLESKIAKFIKANIPLWEKILEYGPLELGELQSMLKKQDIICTKEFLKDFMRRKGVTWVDKSKKPRKKKDDKKQKNK